MKIIFLFLFEIFFLQKFNKNKEVARGLPLSTKHSINQIDA